MNNSTLHIKKPSPQLLKFLKDQREKKEHEKQEVLRVADLLFPSKECDHCEKNLPKT